MFRISLSALLATVLVGPDQHAAATPRTWVLQIEGDAVALRVAGATAKPFRFRAPRGSVSDTRIALVDAAGNVVATVPLDLSPFCLDRAHRRQPPHLRGDVMVRHDVVCTVKVPVRGDVVRLRIERWHADRPPEVLGKIDRAALRRLIERDQREVK